MLFWPNRKFSKFIIFNLFFFTVSCYLSNASILPSCNCAACLEWKTAVKESYSSLGCSGDHILSFDNKTITFHAMHCLISASCNGTVALLRRSLQDASNIQQMPEKANLIYYLDCLKNNFFFWGLGLKEQICWNALRCRK